MDKKTEFYTIRDSSTAEIIEKKSRFIANAYHVDRYIRKHQLC